MTPSLTDILCTRCGLCCDGSLFADAELASSDEAAVLEAMGLEIEEADGDDGRLLLQPCAALNGKRCSIYPHRPDCCQTFECRLLQEVRRGTVGIVAAKARIAEAFNQIKRVKGLAAHLGQSNKRLSLKERCVEALAHVEESPTHPWMNRKRAELETAMVSVEHLLQEVFLGGERYRRSAFGRSAFRQIPA